MMKKVSLLIVMISFMGCASINKTVTTKFDGEKLFEKKCSTCHRLYSPSEYTYEKWQEIIAMCADNAELSEKEHNQIINYLKNSILTK